MSRRPSSSIDRLPPHSAEAEQGVLGSILLDPEQSPSRCVERIPYGARAFYEIRHQRLYSVLIDMFDDSKPIDLVTVTQTLKDRSLIEEVGGLAYLNTLMDAVPSALNLDFYIDILRQKYTLRQIVSACSKITSKVFEEPDEFEAIVDGVEREILTATKSTDDEVDLTMKPRVMRAVEMLEEFHENRGKILGIETGFTDLDKMTHGLNGGEMFVLAARPSMGKTSLAMNIAEYVSIETGLPVGIFSLEMTADSLSLRMLCGRSRVNLREVRDGFFTERDFPRITQAASELCKAPIAIDDTGGLTILQLRARARRMAQQHGIKLLVIDYLQLLTSPSRKADNRQQEVAEISSGIKALAKELNVPVIVLSQLNRDMEKDKSRKPRMSDLRESGAIEQDADIVGLLYRPDQDLEGGEEALENLSSYAVNLLIAKQRNGPTGDVRLTFLKSFTRFENCAKISDADIPN